jgi:antitoxin component YwqK of YwqJK toxin-antitoxin module
VRVPALLVLLFPVLLAAQTRPVKTYFDVQKKQPKEQYQVNAASPPQLHGPYTSYYANGRVKSRGSFSRNLALGLWQYFYENGNPKMAGELRRTGRHGDWKFYYENGQLQSEGAYTDGVRQGYWRFHYESGGPKSEGTFHDDQKTGTWQYYYEDGKPKGTAEHRDGLTYYRELFPSGTPSMEGLLKNDLGDSTWRYYHENGALKATGREKNGEKAGLWKFYQPDGKLASEGEYVNGQPNGAWRYYHENGELASEGQQRNGVREGEWKFYSDTGRQKAQSRYQHGEGMQQEYYPDGKLKARGPVKDGRYEGRWEYYSEEDGSVDGECTFNGGRGTFTGYYPDGKLRLTGTLENDRRVGEWTIYKPDGTVAGYYHTFDEGGLSRPGTSGADDRRSDDTLATATGPAVPYNKPPIRLPRRPSRYFTTRHNEFRGVIVGINPLAPVLGSLPLSVEYYYRERLGYEAGYIVYRRPFLKEASAMSLEKLYNRGFGVYLRQKFYQPDDALGMFYLAHEARFTEMDHRLHVSEADDGGLPYRRTLQADENLYEYSIMVGDRWIADPGGQGFTLEGFLGIGMGYRHYRQRWNDNSRYDSLFDDARKGRVSVPLRLGLSIGYVF